MAVTARSAAPATLTRRGLARRAATLALPAALGVSLLFAVPALRPVLREIGEMDPAWIIAAVALEMASCVSFVVLFRLFFERVEAADARKLAWTSMASGVLLPGGGVGGLAIGGWLMHLAGAPTRWIVRRSSALFFLTSAVSGAAIVVAALVLAAGVAGPHDFDRVELPGLAAAALIGLGAMAPWIVARRGAAATWLDGVTEGIRDARRMALHPSWRLAGALGYLGFDIAVLWAAFSAIGHAPPLPALVLGYTIGYLANAVPIPGGAGVLDAGLVGALVLYGATPTHAVAAVLVYRAAALWIPALGGVIAYTRLRPRLVGATASDDERTAP
jgi:uncharacterized membrane protein YbhN (UPF0104 family)